MNFASFSEQRHRGADAWGISESHQWALHRELNITVSPNLLRVWQAVVSSARYLTMAQNLCVTCEAAGLTWHTADMPNQQCSL